MTKNAYNLQRFIDAQNPVFEQVLIELEMGEKQTHWMWFVFPQIKGLGQSATAKHYAIASADEARAYLAHPLLGPRLEQCTRLVNSLAGTTAEDIFGPVDTLKFRSSMTLFAAIAQDNTIFKYALEKFYGGVADERTVALLR